tara:strand:+ start:69 stop:509 length:441 start_codon:yes stop_codon:yes gene_type:complete
MAERKIAGTNVAYTGMVVRLGEFEYTTVGGGIEGDRQQLEPLDTNTTDLQGMNIISDVVTPFVVGDGSMFGNGTYFYSDGSVVTNETQLHHHTIVPQGRTSNFMTQHIMDGNDVDVFTNTGGQADDTNINEENQQSGGGNGGGGMY